MNARDKTYVLIFLTALVIALLLGPPLAFATKLPTACNVFKEKKAAKCGPCGHQVTFSKDKFHCGEISFSNGGDSISIEAPVAFQNNHFPLFSPSVIFLNSPPLRC